MLSINKSCNCITCKKFICQTLLWLLKFVILKKICSTIPSNFLTKSFDLPPTLGSETGVKAKPLLSTMELDSWRFYHQEFMKPEFALTNCVASNIAPLWYLIGFQKVRKSSDSRAECFCTINCVSNSSKKTVLPIKQNLYQNIWHNCTIYTKKITFLEAETQSECWKVLCELFYRSTPPEVFCKATLLKSHFEMGVLLLICCLFLEHLFLGTPLDGCFCILRNLYWKCFSKNTKCLLENWTQIRVEENRECVSNPFISNFMAIILSIDSYYVNMHVERQKMFSGNHKLHVSKTLRLAFPFKKWSQ